MSDNTIINPGQNGDTIRDLARQGGAIKTQTFALDLGGPSNNAEILITAGQQIMAASVPVVLASDQPAISTADSANPFRGTSTYSVGIAGSVAIASGARIVAISATSITGGTITILGGAAIPVASNTVFTEGWCGFVGPGNVVFTGTSNYYIVVNN